MINNGKATFYIWRLHGRLAACRSLHGTVPDEASPGMAGNKPIALIGDGTALIGDLGHLVCARCY